MRASRGQYVHNLSAMYVLPVYPGALPIGGDTPGMPKLRAISARLAGWFNALGSFSANCSREDTSRSATTHTPYGDGAYKVKIRGANLEVAMQITDHCSRTDTVEYFQRGGENVSHLCHISYRDLGSWKILFPHQQSHFSLTDIQPELIFTAAVRSWAIQKWAIRKLLVEQPISPATQP